MKLTLSVGPPTILTGLPVQTPQYAPALDAIADDDATPPAFDSKQYTMQTAQPVSTNCPHIIETVHVCEKPEFIL